MLCNSRHRRTGNTQIRFEVSKNEMVRTLDEVSFRRFVFSLSSTEHRDLDVD